MAKNYIGDDCAVCGKNVRRKSNDRCISCFPSKHRTQEERRRLRAVRERIEEHQHRHDYQF